MKRSVIIGLTWCLVSIGIAGTSWAAEPRDKPSRTPATTGASSNNGVNTDWAPRAQQNESPAEMVKRLGYRDITREDGVRCGAYIDSLEFSFGGYPSGKMKRFVCIDSNGGEVEIELISTSIKDGRIETNSFGTIIMRSTGPTSAAYMMTDEQIKRMRAYVASREKASGSEKR